MAMDMNAAVKITASVSGTSAIEDLKKSIEGVSNSAGSIKGRFDAISGAMKGFAAAAGIISFVDFAKGVIHSVAALDDMSEKTGASVENLSGLSKVAKVSGTDIEQVSDALVKLTKALKGQDADSRGAAEALKYLGISMAEFRSLDPAEQMLRVAKEMDRFRDGAGKTALALDLFGKAGANILPFLKDLAEEGALNSRVTAEQAAQAEAFEKNLNRLTMQFEGWKRSVAIDLIPVLKDFTQGLRDVAEQSTALGGKNEIVSFAENAAVALAVLIDVVILLGKTIRAVFGSLEAVYADISALGAIAGNGVQSFFSEESRANLTRALNERNRIVEEANRRYSELWNYNGTAYYDAVRARMGQSRVPGAVEPPKPPATYNPISDKADENAKKLETQINTIEKYRIAQIGALSARRLELESVSMTALEYKNLNDARAIDLKNAEMSVGLLPEAKKRLDAVTESLKAQTIAYNIYEDAVKKSPTYGAQSFLKTYLDDVSDMGKQTKKVMEDAFKGAEDALVNFVKTGKLNFSSLIDSIITDIARMAIRSMILQPIANMFGGMLGGFIGGGSTFTAANYASRAASAAPGMYGPGFALGGAFVDGIQAFASGGIVARPTLFPMARGAGLMGEAGPEAIMPLRRGADGRLGVSAPSSPTIVNVNVNDQNNSKVSVTQSQNPGGGIDIDVLVEAAVSRSIAKNGGIAQAIQNRYGLNRAGGR